MTAMAAAAAATVAAAPRSKHRNHCRLVAASPSPATIPSRCSFRHARRSLSFLSSPLRRVSSSVETSVAAAASSPSGSSFHGPCYVVGDNIDTDQIIPAQYLTLVPSKPDEYRKLGSYALIGLPTGSYSVPFIEAGLDTTRFPIIIAGANFGCGSSREHAPVALGAAGVRAVVAESYARIFFRNSIATGEVYPVEADGEGLWRECSTGDIVTVDISENTLINHSTGKEYMLKPMGDLGPVIDAGGIFAYARQTGMIPSAEAS